MVSDCNVMNNLVHDIGLPTCTALLHQASRRSAKTTAVLPPDIHGKWLSTSCESRPGPRYVLRSYSFHRDSTFQLALHFYRDPSCAHPVHTLSAHGHITMGRPSWVTPGGTEAEYTLTKVEVIAHSHRDAALIAAQVNATCPGKVNKPWKPHRPHTVLAYMETTNDVAQDEDCTRGLGGAWHELQLLRVEETRLSKLSASSSSSSSSSSSASSSSSSSSPTVTSGAKRELFLGDLHTDVNKQDLYRPTGYQTPLVNAKHAVDCGICNAVARSSERSPPHLHAGPNLPLILAGSWASSHCETRPYGMFLTRYLTFSPEKSDWAMTLRYYHDPECSRPSFTLAATGSYRRANPPPYAYDMNVNRLVLTPEDADLANELNAYKGKECGDPGKWVAKISQDVTHTGGCLAVGVRVPTVEKEIMRSGIDDAGRIWLTLGQTATSARQEGNNPRPTSWGARLLRCQPYASPDDDNSLLPMVGARTASSGSHKSALPLFVGVMSFLLLNSFTP
ncbi:protein APCDD1-like isoform X2 [Macrobrachium rosenbergii]